MRPIDELIDKTIDEVPLEELQAEFDERARICSDITASGSKHRSAVLTRQVRSGEALSLSREIMRVTFNPEAVFPPHIEGMTPQEAFHAGMEFEAKRADRIADCNRLKSRKKDMHFAARRADELFKKDKTARRGEVARAICFDLGIIKPAQKDIRRVKRWMEKAEANGLLTIPLSASDPGASEK